MGRLCTTQLLSQQQWTGSKPFSATSRCFHFCSGTWGDKTWTLQRRFVFASKFVMNVLQLTGLVLIWHEYLVAPMIRCDFEHFRVSGSIPTGQLLCSFTEAIRVASPFDQNSQKFWFFFVLRFFILRFFILRSYIEYVDSVSTVATEM